MLMLIISLACTGFMMACMFIATHLVDKLLKRFHNHHPSEWEQAGQPCGWSWRPDGWGRFEAALSRVNVRYPFILWRQPDWVKLDPEMLALWKRVHRIFLIMLVACVLAALSGVSSIREKEPCCPSCATKLDTEGESEQATAH